MPHFLFVLVHTVLGDIYFLDAECRVRPQRITTALDGTLGALAVYRRLSPFIRLFRRFERDLDTRLFAGGLAIGQGSL